MHKPILQQLIMFSLTLFVCVINFHLLIAQNPLVKQWDKRFGGYGNDQLNVFKQTADAGFILGGISSSDSGADKSQPSWGQTDYWVVKIDSLGNKQWDKRFGGINNDWLYALQQTADGGYLLGGYSESGISGDKTQASQGSWDFWIVKLDAQGNLQWDKRYGGNNDDLLTSLQQTADGGYILGGNSNSTISGDKTQDAVNGSSDYWMVKIDAAGVKQWDKCFGGNFYESFAAVHQTYDGGYILGGYSNSDSTGDKTQPTQGVFDYWMVKTDSLGNKEWDKDFGGSDFDILIAMQQTADSGYLLAGHSASGAGGDKTQPSNGGTDYWIVKTDAAGNKQWDKDFGGSAAEDEFGNIAQTKDGGYLFGGASYSPISGDKTENNLGVEQSWIIKTDSMGIKQWDKTIFTTGHDETGFAIETMDGTYAFANMTNAGTGGYKTEPAWDTTGLGIAYDYWLIRFYDSTQVTFPVVSFASSDTVFCDKQCISFTDMSINNPTSWQWFFPGADTSTSSVQNPANICYSNAGSFDVTLIACNAAGCDTMYLPGFITEHPALTPAITQSNDTLFSSPGVTYQWFNDNGIIAGATNNYYLPVTGGNYYVVVTDSMECDGTSNVIAVSFAGIYSPLERGRGCVISPNPNNGNFTISWNENLNNDFSLRILNSLGQTINNCQWSIVNGHPDSYRESMVNLGTALKGVYTVEVIGDKVYRARFVVQ